MHPSGRPLLVIVSRLTEQKGLPLMLHGVRVALERGAQVVVLGAAPSPAVQQQFVEMQQQWQAGDRARVVLRFDEGARDCARAPASKHRHVGSGRG